MREIIAVDICNTLADVNQVLDENFCVRSFGEYHHPAVNEKDFFLKNLWIFKESKEIPYSNLALSLLVKYYDLLYLTARPKESNHVTTKWLISHNYPKGAIIFTDSKSEEALKRKISLCIDDSPYEVNRFISSNVPVIIPAQDYNKNYNNRFSWKELWYKLLYLQDVNNDFLYDIKNLRSVI